METVFIDEHLNETTIIQYEMNYEEYYYVITNSINYSLKWLHKNVLIHPNDGYHLRKRLKYPIRYNSKMNIYLVNSCHYWQKKLRDRNFKKQQVRSGYSLPRITDEYPDNSFELNETGHNISSEMEDSTYSSSAVSYTHLTLPTILLV